MLSAGFCRVDGAGVKSCCFGLGCRDIAGVYGKVLGFWVQGYGGKVKDSSLFIKGSFGRNLAIPSLTV